MKRARSGPATLGNPPRRPRLVGKALMATLGPSSLNARVIKELESVGVTTFRINMSHTDLGELDGYLDLIQRSTGIPVCIDTEGAQMRTGRMREGIRVSEGSKVRLVPEAVYGDASNIPITPGSIVAELKPSTRVSIDFDSVLLNVDRLEDGRAEATVVTGGEIGSRKAVTALPSPELPGFSPKDRKAIERGLQRSVAQYALSFCEEPRAIEELRQMVGDHATIIAKVESRRGVQNLASIAQAADAILIDRGDLSREVRLEAIPLLQKAIIRRANSLGVPVYVATNLLESMVARRTPTRAEVNDVMNTLLDGADGLVLAAETAIGRYPVEAARMIARLVQEYSASIDGYRIVDLLGAHPLSGPG